ncbi:MAG: sensor histidine kinase [Planctomycetota bacterium]
MWSYSVIFTAIVSITPLLLMTFANYYQYQKTLAAETIYPISRLVSSSRESLQGFLEERRAALTYVTNREPYTDLCDHKKLNRIYSAMKNSFGGIVDLGVIDSDGKQRAYSGPYELEGRNYRDQDWFYEARLKGIYISNVFLGYRNFPHFVIAVRKDIGEGDDFYILRATIDSDVLARYTTSLQLKSSSDAFLIDHDGILQTPSRHSGKVLEQGPVLPPPFSSKTEIMEVTNKQGDPRVLGYAYIEQSPFIFVVLKNPADVRQSWLYLRSNTLWLLGTSIILILLVILWSSTRLVNRIRESDERRSKALHNVEYTNKMASIGRMAAGVAHEINNPLAIINENAGLLKDLVSMEDSSPDKERVLKIAETVIRSVERCSKITHRLLGFAKRMEPRVERLELTPLITEVLSFQGKEAEHRNITVNVNAPEGMPAIQSDRGQLQQVFLNILNNAFAAVDDGGKIDISLELENENTVAVTISDNGPGIPEENIERIFEPFFSTKGGYGTGLGLSITFGIIEKLGGTVSVQSTVGEGASFTIRLPVKKRS